MFMEMSTLFLKKIKKFLSLFLWLFALGNDRINEIVFQKEKSGMEGIALDKTAECKLVLDTAVLAGKIMLQSGAEIHRVEDTIHRILKVSGMKTAEAFVMPTGLIVTLDDPRMDSMTVVKRIKTRGTNLSRIAEVNDISRRFCSGNISLEEAFHSLKHMKQYTYTALQKIHRTDHGSVFLCDSAWRERMGCSWGRCGRYWHGSDPVPWKKDRVE